MLIALSTSALAIPAVETIEVTNRPQDPLSVVVLSGTITTHQPDGVDFRVRVTTGSVSTFPMRPSQAPGRVHVDGFLANLSANATAHIVTPGKTLYIKNANLQFYNTSTGASGDIRIQDGGITKMPCLVPVAGLGNTPPSASLCSFDLTEPKRFTNSVNIRIVTGTIFYSLSFTGYEE